MTSMSVRAQPKTARKSATSPAKRAKAGSTPNPAADDVTAIVRKYRVAAAHFHKDSLGYLLWLNGRNWNRHLEQNLRVVKLNHIEAGLLLAIYFSHADGRVPTQAHLAAFTRYDPMMVSKALRGLEKRGYIRRRPKAAANLITLTDKGGAVLAKVSDIKTRAMSEFFGGLGNERGTLTRLLKTLMRD